MCCGKQLNRGHIPYLGFQIREPNTVHLRLKLKADVPFTRTPPHFVAPLRHRPPQPPLCSDEGCHCSMPLSYGVVAIHQRWKKVGSFQRVHVRGGEEWGPTQFRGCCRNSKVLRGVSCWWQMTCVLLFMVQRWFRRDLDRSCVEDGGSVVISHDSGFEQWWGSLRWNSRWGNGGEVCCGESLKI